MLEKKAQVTQVYLDAVEVEYEIDSSCSSCASESNCGVGTVAKAFSGKTQTIRLKTQLVLNVGQWVTITTLEHNLLLAAAIAYLLPLVGLVLASVLGQYCLVQLWLWPSYSAILFGITGGVLSHTVGRHWLTTYAKNQPEIVLKSADYH